MLFFLERHKPRRNVAELIILLTGKFKASSNYCINSTSSTTKDPKKLLSSGHKFVSWQRYHEARTRPAQDALLIQQTIINSSVMRKQRSWPPQPLHVDSELRKRALYLILVEWTDAGCNSAVSWLIGTVSSCPPLALQVDDEPRNRSLYSIRVDKPKPLQIRVYL